MPAVLGALGAHTVVGLGDFPAPARLAQDYPGATVALACALLWAVLLALVPLTAAMGLTGICGTALFIGFGPAFSAFATEASDFLTNSQIDVLPLFLMMGSFCAVAGMADDVYALAHAALSNLRGGLAMATIGGCAAFGAVTGSSVATAATIGRVALPEMQARGYAPALSLGCVAAGGTLGQREEVRHARLQMRLQRPYQGDDEEPQRERREHRVRQIGRGEDREHRDENQRRVEHAVTCHGAPVPRHSRCFKSALIARRYWGST